jgi:Family of unknown function (DUF5681)
MAARRLWDYETDSGIHRRGQRSAGRREKKKRKSERIGISAKTGRRGNPDKTIPYRWKPGQSGNPDGRPKNDLAREIARGVFEDDPELIRQAFRNALRKGNAYVFKELADRAYGRTPQRLEHTGDEGGPIDVKVRFMHGKLKEMK